MGTFVFDNADNIDTGNPASGSSFYCNRCFKPVPIEVLKHDKTSWVCPDCWDHDDMEDV